MSSPWKLLRSDVVIADLATTDIDMEALQTEGAGIEWKSPSDNRIPAKGVCEMWAFKVLAADDAGTATPGTLTAQLIDRSPNTSADSYHYSGSEPEVSLPTGRVFTVPGSTFHEFTVRCSSVVAAGATKLNVWYRPLF
jgi:hypothetical protein